MSYDVSLQISTGGEQFATVYSDNITSNVARMYNLALFKENGLNYIHGMSAKCVSDLLARAVSKMKDYPGSFKSLEPKNGWGTAQQALSFLERLQQACIEHPGTTVYIY